MEQLNLFEPTYQPRFQAYLNHVGKTHVDDIKIWEFMSWISKQRLLFATINELPDDQPLNVKMHKEFTEYLMELEGVK